MAERINSGYTIIQSICVGDTEFVLGENPKAPDSYVTWECTHGTNYYWGHYFDSYYRARTDLFERARELSQREEERAAAKARWGKGDGNDDQAHDAPGADVLLYPEPADHGTDRLYRPSAR